MDALQHLTVLPLTKSEREDFVAKAKNEILSGYYNPLQIEACLKGIEETIKALRADEDIRSQVLDECEKYGEKTFTVGNTTFTLQERKTYDFKACGDTKYMDLIQELERIKERIKGRELMLKSITKPVADTETGNIINPAPYSQQTVLQIKIQ
jgi:hypothetical protein